MWLHDNELHDNESFIMWLCSSSACENHRSQCYPTHHCVKHCFSTFKIVMLWTWLLSRHGSFKNWVIDYKYGASCFMGMQWCKQQKSIVLYSLLENVWPSRPDKVPCQRLTSHIVGNVDNGGGGILLSDKVWIQSELQVSERVQAGQQVYMCVYWSVIFNYKL